MRIGTVTVFLGAAALATSAFGLTKTSGKAQCKGDPPAPVEIGDKPGHAFAISKAHCTWSGFEIAGAQYKDGVSVSLDEINGDKSTSNGYHTATLANGEQTVAHFQGTGTSKDGKFVSGGGTWTFTSGYREVQEHQKQGHVQGTPNADGTVTYQVNGEYSLP